MRHLYRLIILSFILISHANSETAPRARYVGVSSLRETPTPVIEIGWDITGSGYTHMQVQRALVTPHPAFRVLGYVTATQRSFSDSSNLAVGASYFYRVRTCNAINALGNCTDPGPFRWSKKIKLNELLPFAPGGLIGVVEYQGASTNLAVKLNWNDYNDLKHISFRNGNASNERGFVVERKLSGQPNAAYLRIAALSANTNSYTDNTVLRDQSYVYRVGAIDKNAQVIFAEGIHEYEQRVEDFYLSKEYLCNKLTTQQALPPYVINFNTYRRSEDRRGDDYEATRRAAIDFSNKQNQARILIYPPGRYHLNRYEDTLLPENVRTKNIGFKNSSKFRIVGCNATVSVRGSFLRVSERVQSGESTDVCGDVHPLMTETRKTDALQAFRFENVEDATLEGFEIYGQGDKTIANGDMPESSSMGVFTKNVRKSTFKDLYIHHFIGDGIYLGQGQNLIALDPSADSNLRIADRNIRIHNVRSYHNRRQGMTIVQARGVWVSNSQFSLTGLTGSSTHKGHSPMAGIDVEPNYFTMSKNDPGRTADEQFSYPGQKVDITTGDILIENSEMKNNLGGSLISSLGRKIRHCPNGAVIGTEWPVARIENMTLRFSSFVAPKEVPENLVVEYGTGTLGIAVKEASLENSYVDLGSDRLRVSTHTGTATNANKNDALISVRITNNFIRSSGLSIDGGNGRHPLSVINNIIVGTHQSFPSQAADEGPNGLKMMSFVRVFRSQVAKRDTRLAFDLPIGPNTAPNVRANRSLLLDPAGVREFKNNTFILPSVLYQTSGPVAQRVGFMASTQSSGNQFITPSLKGVRGEHFYIEGLSNPSAEYFENCSIRPLAGYAQCRDEGYVYPE